MGRIGAKNLLGLATLGVAFLGLSISYNQYETQKVFREIQHRIYLYEVTIGEGQLAASLLTSLIRGDEAERRMAVLILKLKAPKLFEELMPIISEKDPSPEVRELAKREYSNLQISNLLDDARIFMELKRYGPAAQYFYQAASYADTARLDKSLLGVAISRYHAHSDSLAAELFQQLFSDY